MIWHFCRSVSTLKGRRSGTARHQSSLVIQRVEQSTAVTVNGFTGTYVRMTAIMIRSNRIMHGRCHDNDAAKRGQIVVTQFRQSMTGIPGSGDVQNRSDRPSSFLIFLPYLTFPLNEFSNRKRFIPIHQIEFYIQISLPIMKTDYNYRHLTNKIPLEIFP